MIAEPNKTVRFSILDIPQATNARYTGYYAVFMAYLVIHRQPLFVNSFDDSKLEYAMSEFLTTGILLENLMCQNRGKTIKEYLSFSVTIYCHCKLPDIGSRMKSCDSCMEWFHEHCETFNDKALLLTWFCRTCAIQHEKDVQPLFRTEDAQTSSRMDTNVSIDDEELPSSHTVTKESEADITNEEYDEMRFEDKFETEDFITKKDKVETEDFITKKDKEIDYLNNMAVVQGDITQLKVDAIVNAANEKLIGGGGVDGAIHRAAGPSLLMECQGLGGCEAGAAKLTAGYLLPSKYVIHTVGPRNQSKTKLRECYISCLKLASDYSLKTIAFPCIGTGVYAFPQKEAAIVAFKAVEGWLTNNDQNLKVIFCVYGDSDFKLYQKLLKPIERDQNTTAVDCVRSKGCIRSKDRKEVII